MYESFVYIAIFKMIYLNRNCDTCTLIVIVSVAPFSLGLGPKFSSDTFHTLSPIFRPKTNKMLNLYPISKYTPECRLKESKRHNYAANSFVPTTT